MSSLRLKAATHAGGVHIMAERVGFEPTVRIATYTRFPGVRLKPLIHLSDERILALRSYRPSGGRKFKESAGLCAALQFARPASCTQPSRLANPPFANLSAGAHSGGRRVYFRRCASC